MLSGIFVLHVQHRDDQKTAVLRFYPPLQTSLVAQRLV